MVAFLRTASAATAASAAEAETALRKFATAWEKKDLGAALGVFTADAVVYDPVPPGVFDTPEAIKGWIAGAFQAMDHISITVSAVKGHASGAMVFLNAHYVFKATAGGKPAGDEGNLTTVWVRQDDGSYKLVTFHASIPPALPAAPPAK